MANYVTGHMIIATDDADTCGDLDKNLAGRRDATLAGGTPRLEETTVLGKTYWPRKALGRLCRCALCTIQYNFQVPTRFYPFLGVFCNLCQLIQFLALPCHCARKEICHLHHSLLYPCAAMLRYPNF